MTDLTEQWKKGELNQGYYYTKYTPKVGKPFVEIELRNYLLDLAKVRDADTVEVLAPVPSYEEWQKVLNIDFNNEVLRLENAKLKELLKECQHMILAYSINHDTFTKDEVKDITTKTDEVLK